MSQFSIEIEGSKGVFLFKSEEGFEAEMSFSKAGEKMIIIDHTDVAEELRGTGTGELLARYAVDYARTNDIKIIPLCPFAKSVFDKNPELRDVLR